MLAAFLLVGRSLASPTFPPVLETESGTACTVPCTVCHATLIGGAGTVTQEFGATLLERGLVSGDEELLAELFAEVADEGLDSDGDGTSDADELAAGFDPNPEGLTFCDVEPPVYGCFSHTGAAPMGPLAVAGLLLLRARRRR